MLPAILRPATRIIGHDLRQAKPAIIDRVGSFYTRLGDDGTTGLLGAGRVSKDHARPEAYGTVDEASAALGLARAMAHSKQAAEISLQAQRDLYHLMAELAATPQEAPRFRVIDAGRVAWLEEQMDDLEAKVNMPQDFVVSGDSQSGAAFDLARTVVRRAERLVVRLHRNGEVESLFLLSYLNRLSSLCFVLSLWENQQAGVERPSLAREG